MAAHLAHVQWARGSWELARVVAGQRAARRRPGSGRAHGRAAALPATRWGERRRFWEGTWARLDLARCALVAEADRAKLGAARRTEIAAWVAALPATEGPAER
jgi:hypothetical protein